LHTSSPHVSGNINLLPGGTINYDSVHLAICHGRAVRPFPFVYPPLTTPLSTALLFLESADTRQNAISPGQEKSLYLSLARTDAPLVYLSAEFALSRSREKAR
jgi:hypothetical protein